MNICVVERCIMIRAMHLKGVVMDQQRVSTQVSLRSLRKLTWAKAVCYRLIFCMSSTGVRVMTNFIAMPYI